MRVGIFTYAIAAAVAGLALPAAAASLIGTNASVAYYFPDVATPYAGATASPANFAIGAGTETMVDVEGVTNLVVDFDANSVSVLFQTVLNNPTWNATGFNGLVFTSPAFAGLGTPSINAISTLAGFGASRVSIVGNDLRLDWNGLGYVDGSTIRVDFATAAVPEPASWALLIGGFGLVGVALRRRSALA